MTIDPSEAELRRRYKEIADRDPQDWLEVAAMTLDHPDSCGCAPCIALASQAPEVVLQSHARRHKPGDVVCNLKGCPHFMRDWGVEHLPMMAPRPPGKSTEERRARAGKSPNFGRTPLESAEDKVRAQVLARRLLDEPSIERGETSLSPAARAAREQFYTAAFAERARARQLEQELRHVEEGAARLEKCAACNGTGGPQLLEAQRVPGPCDECGGTGVIDLPEPIEMSSLAAYGLSAHPPVDISTLYSMTGIPMMHLFGGPPIAVHAEGGMVGKTPSAPYYPYDGSVECTIIEPSVKCLTCDASDSDRGQSTCSSCGSTSIERVR